MIWSRFKISSLLFSLFIFTFTLYLCLLYLQSRKQSKSVIFHLLVHCTKACNNCGWARPGTQHLIWEFRSPTRIIRSQVLEPSPAAFQGVCTLAGSLTQGLNLGTFFMGMQVSRVVSQLLSQTPVPCSFL